VAFFLIGQMAQEIKVRLVLLKLLDKITRDYKENGNVKYWLSSC
jgi:hypothetical protein